LDEWTAIVDAYNDALAVARVGDFQFCPETHGTMCRRQSFWVHTLAGCSLGMKSVPGSAATTIFGECCLCREHRCDDDSCSERRLADCFCQFGTFSVRFILRNRL